MSVVFRLNEISLVPTWQSGLSHLDQGPTGDVVTDKAMGYAVTALIRGDKDITLGYRLQGKLKSRDGKEGKYLHWHIVLSKRWKYRSNTWARDCEEER